jgi:hypothetical protein
MIDVKKRELWIRDMPVADYSSVSETIVAKFTTVWGVPIRNCPIFGY